MDRQYLTHITHWGAFQARSDGSQLTDVKPLPDDPDPYPLIDNVASAQHHAARIDRPYVRESWLHQRPSPDQPSPDQPSRDQPSRDRSYSDRFIPIEWPRAISMLGDELQRVYSTHGAASVYGGSYGWASAGRFHHCQSQLHRFLNCLGGFTSSVNSYSYGTSEVLLPHIVGSADLIMRGATSWQSIAGNTDLVVAFGGLPRKNAAATAGGVRHHSTSSWLKTAHERGTKFVSVSPLRDDTCDEIDPQWLAIWPGTDTALMLALAHVLISQNLLDRSFLRSHTVGFNVFESYVTGAADGIAKTPEWAEEITHIAAQEIHRLATRMTTGRTMVTVSWSLQRNQHGEQPVWLAIVLAAMLGQIGLPGGGFGHGYSSSGYIGQPRPAVAVPSLRQGHNPVPDFIPVARIADMLLRPGETFGYNGKSYTYPDIKLVYWCGGNPFHHHQNLARLRTAFTRPETVVVHEQFWTSTARHADIVLPATMSIERNDFAVGKNEATVTAMPQLTTPAGQARDDFDIFADLSAYLGVGADFTQHRNESQWLRYLYAELAERLTAHNSNAAVPDFDEFWRIGTVDLPVAEEQILLEQFRANPGANPLATPSGKIEIFSQPIADANAPHVAGHPVWNEPDESPRSARAADYPIQLLANQPKTRLHSQLDIGKHSQDAKISGREPVRMNAADAATRGLATGDTVIISSAHGRCLAGLHISDQVAAGVAQLSTGAWYDPDPDDPQLCRQGNPNVLTADIPSSELSQGCTGSIVMVQIERAADSVGNHGAFTLPPLAHPNDS